LFKRCKHLSESADAPLLNKSGSEMA
jgi:hypothetical protein